MPIDRSREAMLKRAVNIDKSLVSIPKKRNNDLMIRMILYMSIIALFNVEIRSIGHTGVVDDIGPIWKFWLSDIGLMIPICWLILKNANVFSRSVLPITAGLIIYGVFIAAIRDNPMYAIGYDLRTILCFLCGFASISLMSEIKSMMKYIINVEIMLTIGAIAIIVLMPGSGFLQTSERITHPSSFILLDIPIIVFSTTILYANNRGNTKLYLKAWSCGILLLITASVIMQTRSMFLTILFGFVFSVAGIFEKWRIGRIKRKNKIAFACIMIFVIAGVIPFVFNKKAENLNKFIGRIKSGYDYTYTNDFSIRTRLDEISTVFSKMSIAEHVFGMGLNPRSELIYFQGISHNILHIGIFNIWWRFGFIVFIIANILILKASGVWIIALLRKKKWDSKRNRTAIIICTPGLMVAYVTSLSSGGFIASFTYGIGMIYGLYVMITKHGFHLKEYG